MSETKRYYWLKLKKDFFKRHDIKIIEEMDNGKDYILFKQNGKVQFIIPVAKKESTPMNFYEANVPQPKLTMWQSFCKKVRKKFYDTATDAKRITPPNSLVNVDVDSKYILLNMYYEEDKFVLVFKRTPY